MQKSGPTKQEAQLRCSTTRKSRNTSSSKHLNITALDSHKKEVSRPIFKKPMTLVAYKKPDLVTEHSSMQKSLGGQSAKIASDSVPDTKHGSIPSKSGQKSQRVRISKKLTTDVPEIVAPNFEKRILKLKEEMATLEIHGSTESKKKTTVFDNDNESSSTHRDHCQVEFEHHLYYSDSDSDSEYDSDSGDEYEEHRIDEFSHGNYDYDYSSTDSDSEYESESDDDSNYQSSDSDEYEDNSVWVGNIPKSAEADDLNSVFGKFGKIIQITIRSTNHPTFDYAFIDFKSSGSAQALLRKKCEESFFLDGIELVVVKRHY